MKKTISRQEYDTETAALIKKRTSGHYGDPTGFEESLYQTPGGLYFLYVNGGAASPYPTEDIMRMGKAKAQDWVAGH